VLQEDLTLPVGASIQDHKGERYIVDDLLGQGGFSTVYLVHEKRARNNLYALKELIDPKNRDRTHLTFEAEVLRRLKHRSLPHVYQVFEDTRLNRLYMLMDYIKGKNLEVLRNEQPHNRFSLALAMALLTPIVDALTYLHAQQPPIIHRDLKPSNIVIPLSANDAVLVDFGLAKEYVADKTTNVFRFGTPGYAAPEQYGQGTNTRTDIYAIGATLYTLLTGKIPADALSRTFSNNAEDPCRPAHEVYPAISRKVSAVITKSMKLNNEERYATVEEFWQALSIAIIQPATDPSTAVATNSTQPLPLSKEDLEILATANMPAISAEQSRLAPTTQGGSRQKKESNGAEIPIQQPVPDQPRHNGRLSAYQQQQRKQRRHKYLLLALLIFILIVAGGNIGLFMVIYYNSRAADNKTISTPISSPPQCNNGLAQENNANANYPRFAECYVGTINSLQNTGNGKADNYQLIVTQQNANTVNATFIASNQHYTMTGVLTPNSPIGLQTSTFRLDLRSINPQQKLRLDIHAQVDGAGDINGPTFDIYDLSQNKVVNSGDLSATMYTSTS